MTGWKRERVAEEQNTTTAGIYVAAEEATGTAGDEQKQDAVADGWGAPVPQQREDTFIAYPSDLMSTMVAAGDAVKVFMGRDGWVSGICVNVDNTPRGRYRGRGRGRYRRNPGRDRRVTVSLARFAQKPVTVDAMRVVKVGSQSRAGKEDADATITLLYLRAGALTRRRKLFTLRLADFGVSGVEAERW